jgi:outer membrane immunogenic protein
MYLRHAGHMSARRARRRANQVQITAFATLAASLALASTANSADLAVKAPAAARTYNWGGCYVGANAGGSEAGSDFTTTVGSGTHLAAPDLALVDEGGGGSSNGPGWGGGGQVGCNWQSDTIVYGLEGDVAYFHTNPQFTNVQPPNTPSVLSSGATFTASQMLTTNYLATLRPRLGVAADKNLFYITGGAAFTNASYTQGYVDAAAPPGSGIATGSKTLVGWTVGAGWEYAFADHWTLRFEYLFTSFPDKVTGTGVITDAAGGSNPLQGSANLVMQTARAGVNFKF